jgi:hypothetical protein
MIWHEFDITLSDKKLDEMGIDKFTESKAMIALDNVYSFHKSYNESSDEVTFIMFTNGDTMQVNCSYETMKKIMRCR